MITQNSICLKHKQLWTCVINRLGIKTHDSESRGQEEAAVRDERVSYLQVAPLKNSQTL